MIGDWATKKPGSACKGLFFAMARLELDDNAIKRVLGRMRKVGAVVELDARSPRG
jgi:hypothetical protein